MNSTDMKLCAKKFLENGNISELLQVLEAGVRDFPGDVFFPLSLARLRWHMSEIKQASLAYLKAVQCEPTSAVLAEFESFLQSSSETGVSPLVSMAASTPTLICNLSEAERFWGYLSAQERYPAPYYGLFARRS